MHAKLVDYVERKGINTIFWVQRWDKELFDLRQGYKVGALGGEGRGIFIDRMEHFINSFDDNIDFVIIGSVPGASPASPSMVHGYLRCLYTIHDCASDYRFDLRMGVGENKILSDIADRFDNVLFFDPSQALCDGKRCYIVDQVGPLYSDHAHLTLYGSELLTARLKKFLSHEI